MKRPLTAIVVFFAVAIAQLMQGAAGGAPARSSEKNDGGGSQFTVIHFPQTLSLGSVSVAAPDPKFHTGDIGTAFPATGWRRWNNAYGDVKVPKGMFVRLAVPQHNHDVILALKSVKPDNSIHSLQLGGSDFSSEDWQNIKHFSDLRELALSGNVFSDQSLANLKTLRHLERLDLSRTHISDAGMKPVSELKQLHTLSIGNDNIDDQGVKLLGKMPILCRVDAANVHIGDSIKVLITPHLAGIVLSGTRANDATVKLIASKKPQKLKYLFMGRCKITDNCIPDLIRLTSLNSLVIQDTPISLEGIHRLKQGLPKCRISAGDTHESP